MRDTVSGVKRDWVSRSKIRALRCCLFLLFLCPQLARAQATEDSELDGIKSGDYLIKQSFEFGGRFTDFTGDKSAYDTFVNLRSGPRLLGTTLEMQSLDHNGFFFDRLILSNSGYGGDPNDVTRLRVGKNKWYDFDGMFRRDENAWGYSLLANPLNPATPFPNAPANFSPVIGFSPHAMNLVRRMGDYNLILFPQSKLRFRAGYSRNVAEGPSFSSIHQGTEQVLLQDWKTVVNAYRFGIDYKILPRTRISFDEIVNLYKGDTSYTDPVPTTNSPLQAFPAGSGAGPLVDIGYSRNLTANQPCGSGGTTGPFLASPPNPLGTVLATCSAYFDYFRHGKTRTTTPTEQVSFVSNYWKNLDLTGRFSYSGGDTKVANWMEAWDGRESRTNARNSLMSGPVFGQRVDASADFGAVWHASERLSVSDSFHFSNFHNPMTFDSSLCQFFSANLVTPANVFTPGASTTLPTLCAPPADGLAGTPNHSGSSGPDVSILNATLFQKVDEKTNLFEVAYRFSSKFGARIGYRYRSRSIDLSDAESGTFLFFPSNANGRSPTPPFANQLDQFGNPILDAMGNTIPQRCPVANNLADGSCEISLSFNGGITETQIHEHGALLGIWARPLKNLRVSFDMELMSADNSFTRISPRQTQEYRLRTVYRPAPWATLNGSVRIWEGRDNVTEVKNLQHDRAYGFSISLEPVRQFAIDMGADYNDVHSQILICYVSSAAPKGLDKCPAAGLVQQLSPYQNNSKYGYFDMRISPIRHLTARIGANITYTDGSTLLLNPNAVPGPLNTDWFQPYAGVDYSFTKNWMGRANWGFYDYRENGTTAAQDVFAPRNFRGNMVTLSARYAF
jgi:hypothetical protein